LFVSDDSIFTVGGSYQLVANDGYLKEAFTGEVFNVGKATRVTVTSVSGDGQIEIEEDLTNIYFPSGSRIGRDPQPVCVYLQGMDKIQTLTNISLKDKVNTGDPPFQVYDVSFVAPDFSTNSERIRNSISVSPIKILARGIDDFVGKEYRGSLIGMYYCGDLESGSTLYIDGKQYKVFSIFESQRLTSVAIGPME
jgi:hypothetical protein